MILECYIDRRPHSEKPDEKLCRHAMPSVHLSSLRFHREEIKKGEENFVETLTSLHGRGGEKK